MHLSTTHVMRLVSPESSQSKRNRSSEEIADRQVPPTHVFPIITHGKLDTRIQLPTRYIYRPIPRTTATEEGKRVNKCLGERRDRDREGPMDCCVRSIQVGLCNINRFALGFSFASHIAFSQQLGQTLGWACFARTIKHGQSQIILLGSIGLDFGVLPQRCTEFGRICQQFRRF